MIHSSFLRSYRRVESATPPNLGFQVSKTPVSIESSAFSTFFFLIRFHGSKVSQDSKVLLRVSFLESRLLSALRAGCRVSMLHKVESSGRNRRLAPLERTAWKDLIASQSRVFTLESTLLSASRTACNKSVLHKVESCGRF